MGATSWTIDEDVTGRTEALRSLRADIARANAEKGKDAGPWSTTPYGAGDGRGAAAWGGFGSVLRSDRRR